MWKTHYWFDIQSRHWNLHRFVNVSDAAKKLHVSRWGLTGAWAHIGLEDPFNRPLRLW